MTIDDILSESPSLLNEIPDVPAVVRESAKKAGRIAMGQAMIEGKTDEEVRAADKVAYVETCKREAGLYDTLPVPAPEQPVDALSLLDMAWELPAPSIVQETPVVTEEPAFPTPAEYHAEADARIIEDRALAAVAGLVTKNAIYRQGTIVNEIGVENARAKRAAFEAMPEVSTLCDDLAKRIQDEQRCDVVVPITSITMCSDGPIMVACEDVPLAITEVGLKGLFARIWGGSGFHYLTESCSASLRALNVNAQIGEVADKEADVPSEERKAAKLRLRTNESGRHIFAVVSPTYAKHDADEIAGVIKTAAEGLGMRGELTYDGFQMRINAFGHSTVQPEHYAAGEIFRVGVQVSAKDDGTGAIRVRVVLHQNLCLNLIILHETSRSVGIFRHRGKPEELVAKVRKAIDAAVKMVKPFLDKWKRAQHTDVLAQSQLAGYHGTEIADVFRGILADKIVPVPVGRGGDREEIVSRLVAAYQRDTSSAIAVHPTALAAIVNAFTRFAHEDIPDLVPSDPWAEDVVQESASLLLARTAALPSYTLEEVKLMDGRRKVVVDDAPASA